MSQVKEERAAMLEMLEKAKAFADVEIFTDGINRKARRLVMEFDEKIPGTGWGKVPIADKIATFALAQVAATRGEIAAWVRKRAEWYTEHRDADPEDLFVIAKIEAFYEIAGHIEQLAGGTK